MNSKQTDHIETKRRFPICLALALTLGVFAAGSEELVISPALPDLAQAFSSDVSVLALSISIYGLMIFIGAPLLVPLGDKYSRELSLLAGPLIFTAGTVICALAHNLFFLLSGQGAFRARGGCVCADSICGGRRPCALCVPRQGDGSDRVKLVARFDFRCSDRLFYRRRFKLAVDVLDFRPHVCPRCFAHFH